MPRYRKKPIVVEAFRMTLGERLDDRDWPEWLRAAWELSSNETGSLTTLDGEVWKLGINTLEGVMRVEWGDYIIQGVQGELYPCKPDIFEATYEPVFQPNPDLRFKGSPMSPELEAQFKAMPAEMDRYNTAMRTWLDGQSTTPETRKRARELFGMGPEQANKPAPEPELADSDDLVEGDG